MSTDTDTAKGYTLTEQQAYVLADCFTECVRARDHGGARTARNIRAAAALESATHMISATYRPFGYGSRAAIQGAIADAYHGTRTGNAEEGYDISVYDFAAAILTNVNALT